MKTDLFQSCGHCWVFQICWQIEYSTFTASSFRIWNSSTGIQSPPLALFIVILLTNPAHWVAYKEQQCISHSSEGCMSEMLSHQAQADPANGIKSKANYWKNCAWGKKMVKWMSDHYQWAPKRNNSQYSRHPAMRSQVGLCSSLWTKLMEVIEFQLSYFKS